MSKKDLFRTPSFKKLQSEWYDKLDKSGFDDIERPASSYYWFDEYSGMLKRPIAKILTTKKHSISTLNYFANLGKFAESASFYTKYQHLSRQRRHYLRIIARLSADGFTLRSIQRHLRKKYPQSELSFSDTYMYTNHKRLVADACDYADKVAAAVEREVNAAVDAVERDIEQSILNKKHRLNN